MFCSFTRNPLVLRLYGRTRTGAPGSALWREYAGPLRALARARGRSSRSTSNPCQTACGFGVPVMTLERQRSTLTDYWARQGRGGDRANTATQKNRVSIDGLPTGWGEG